MQINSLNPLVTVGVPFYNAQDYIIDTLDSIKSQTYTNIQLILVNDCSTDESLLLVKNWLIKNSAVFFNVILIENLQNRGTSFSCKRLEEASEGIFFCKLDADDLIHPGKITTQVKYLLTHPEMAMVYSNTLLIDSNGKIMKNDYFSTQQFSCISNNVGPAGFVFDKLIVEDFIPNSSALIRKNILDNIGGYDESLFTEDWDLWLRISRLYPIAFIEGYFSSYRIHSQSVMRKTSSMVKMYLSCCDAVLKHRDINKDIDNVIAKHITTYSIGLYRFGVINKELLRLNFIYNKTIKSAIYYSLGFLNLKVNQNTY